MKKRQITADEIRAHVDRNLMFDRFGPGRSFLLCHCFSHQTRTEFARLLGDFTTKDDLGIVLEFPLYASGEFEQTTRFMFSELLALLVEDGQ